MKAIPRTKLLKTVFTREGSVHKTPDLCAIYGGRVHACKHAHVIWYNMAACGWRIWPNRSQVFEDLDRLHCR